MVETCAEEAGGACLRLVVKVGSGTHDAHSRRRIVRRVRRELDNDSVLDEVKVLRVLVHVEAGRLERVRPLAQPVSVEELDGLARLGLQPLGQGVFHLDETRKMGAHRREHRMREEKGVKPLLVGVVRAQGLAIRRPSVHLSPIVERQHAVLPPVEEELGTARGLCWRHHPACAHHCTRVPRAWVQQRLELHVEGHLLPVHVRGQHGHWQPVARDPGRLVLEAPAPVDEPARTIVELAVILEDGLRHEIVHLGLLVALAAPLLPLALVLVLVLNIILVLSRPDRARPTRRARAPIRIRDGGLNRRAELAQADGLALRERLGLVQAVLDDFEHAHVAGLVAGAQMQRPAGRRLDYLGGRLAPSEQLAQIREGLPR